MTAGIMLDRAVAQAARQLGSRLEADLLAGHALGRTRAWLYAHGETELAGQARQAFEQLVARRLEGYPIAQLVGEREFFSRAFFVDERVLIPRPETELLVELALALPLPARARVCDVGTGSGCIALTLAAERPAWKVTATDRSPDALAVAAINRQRLGLARVELLCGDLLEPVAGRRFDLIVSNPPYVAAGDPHLKRGDLPFEPRQALVAGADGLDIVRRLVPAGHERLDNGGWLLFEHGHGQAPAARALLKRAGFIEVTSRRDLAGIERVSLGMKPAAAAKRG